MKNTTDKIVLETPLRKPPFGILRERDWGTALKGM
jgi:hypothetical protein